MASALQFANCAGAAIVSPRPNVESRSPPTLRRRLGLLAAASILPLALLSGAALLFTLRDQRLQAERNAIDLVS